MKIIRSAVFLFFLAGTGIHVYGQQPVTDTLSIQGVEVKASKPEDAVRSASPLRQIGIRELRALPGSNAADVLRHLSGVTVRDYGGLGGIKTVVVRSLGANHTAVFIDGMPMSDIASGQIDLGKVPLGELEAIDLVSGQERGDCRPARMAASASLISFKSADPHNNPAPLGVKAGIRAGSFGSYNPFVTLSSKILKRTAVALTADYSQTRGDYPFLLRNGSMPDTVMKRINGDVKALNLGLRTETTFSDSSLLKVKGWLYTSGRGLPGAVVYYNPWSAQRMDNADFSGNAIYSFKQGQTRLLSSISVSSARLRYRDPAFLNQQGGLDNTYKQVEVYGSQSAKRPLSKVFSLGAAADVIFNRMSSDRYLNGDPSRLTAMGLVTLNAAGRRTEATAEVLATGVRESAGDGESTRLKGSLTPSFSLSTRITSHPLLRIRLMAKNSFRMPTFHDLYYNLTGNTRLEPEKVSQINLGIILQKEWNRLEARLITDVFANRVRNKIVAVPTRNLFIWSMRNLGVVVANGLEAQALVRVNPAETTSISLSAAYTAQQALDKSDPESPVYGHQIPYIPFHTISGMFSIQHHRLMLGYNTLYNSHRYSLGENITANRLPAWNVHDASVSWKQPLKRLNLTIKLEGVNILNEQYEVIRGFPMNGRSIYATIIAEF
jgi:outer membrane receptor protein involved in Fe transport